MSAMLPRPFLLAACLLGVALGVLLSVADVGAGVVYALLAAVGVAFTVTYARWDERHRP